MPHLYNARFSAFSKLLEWIDFFVLTFDFGTDMGVFSKLYNAIYNNEEPELLLYLYMLLTIFILIYIKNLFIGKIMYSCYIKPLIEELKHD